MVSGVRIKDHRAEQRSFFRRSALAGFVIVGLVLLLLGRLVLLQVVRYGYYTDQAEGNRARLEPIPANRGLILDRNGKVLAENRPSYQLELVREQVGDLKALDRTLAGLAKIGAIPAADVAEARSAVLANRTFDSVPIHLSLSDEEIAAFAVHRHEFPGVEIHQRTTRYYPYGALAVHALGYVGRINAQDLGKIDQRAYEGTTLIGKLGVEQSRESELHGVNGFREILVNAQGRSVQGHHELKDTLRSAKPHAGEDVITSLDLATQQAAEAAFDGRRGAAVAIDPRNGDVLAFVSLPGFDPGIFGRSITSAENAALNDESRPQFDRAIRGQYPAGSTVKPVMGMAGLAYGVIKPEDVHYCPGEYHVPGSSRIAREGKGGVHGAVDLRKAIAVSCDVYFYELAYKLQIDRMHDFLAPFGYGAKTGIDISGEEAGLLPSREQKAAKYRNSRDRSEGIWYPGDSVNVGVGQGDMLVTPMQQAHIAAVLAAKGTVFQPRLVTGLRDPATGETTAIAPIELPHVKGGTPEQWDVIMDGMRQTMTIGTARAIATSAEYHIAGKTGTAQAHSVAQNERLGSTLPENLRDHAWFIAFAPAEDPQIAVAVLVEHGGFGASAAAPIARKIMDAYLLPRLKTAAPAAPPAAAAKVPPA
ncbi:MAG TPA: penicillin-binding protein 2 [Steroidobacteraceae bacterium]|nr:penicillin-binding protein 2 [Steroidobacteraceae bacterium]